jgi:1-acyl-sn-glycerol-3-phosphate acyltransferase
VDFWYAVAKNLVRTYLALFVDDVKVWGIRNIPKGPKIVIANHANATDAFALPFLFPEKLHFFVQGDLFTLPVFGKLLELADQIPVLVGQGKEAVKIAQDKLAQGKTVVVFPEGRLNHGEDMLRAKTGAARLAMDSGVPLVPLGTYVPQRFVKLIYSKRHGRTTIGGWQFAGSLYVQIGKPFQAAQSSAEEGYTRLREVTEHMMEEVALVVNQAMEHATSWPPALPDRAG